MYPLRIDIEFVEQDGVPSYSKTTWWDNGRKTHYTKTYSSILYAMLPTAIPDVLGEIYRWRSGGVEINIIGMDVFVSAANAYHVARREDDMTMACQAYYRSL